GQRKRRHQLRLRPTRRPGVAEMRRRPGSRGIRPWARQAGGRRLDGKAPTDALPPGTNSASQNRVRTQTGVHGEINAVVYILVLPERVNGRPIDEFLTELRGVDVGEPAELLAAAPGEPRIDRR